MQETIEVLSEKDEELFKIVLHLLNNLSRAFKKSSE